MSKIPAASDTATHNAEAADATTIHEPNVKNEPHVTPNTSTSKAETKTATIAESMFEKFPGGKWGAATAATVVIAGGIGWAVHEQNRRKEKAASVENTAKPSR